MSLPVESQHFVDVIRDMGFDEVDVVRAVKELGVDDKLVSLFEWLDRNIIYLLLTIFTSFSWKKKDCIE
jgi:hypothetical protein